MSMAAIQNGGWRAPDLSSTVALVTGASRGVGRGIALALGDGGAKVYVTGRSVREGHATEHLPGTIDDTADEVAARGGSGVAVRCDHSDDADVHALFERISRDEGRLDLLVNNAWSGYERLTEARFDAPFWEQPMWRWDLFAASLRGHFLASRLAAPLMLPQRAGLIVNIGFTDGEVVLGQTAYDVCKHGSDRMAVSMAHELRRKGIAAVALHPGFVKSERVAAAWEQIGEGPAQVAHSSEYVGRAVVSLAADPSVFEVSGRRLAVGDLALQYGFADVDGRQPSAFRLEGRITLATRMDRINRIVAQEGSPAA
jgi:NAD(P)-dependent dehydrogenase (short-subunit alcohol dehydrogenase family)